MTASDSPPQTMNDAGGKGGSAEEEKSHLAPHRRENNNPPNVNNSRWERKVGEQVQRSQPSAM